MKKNLISIILPVYNASPFLNDCLNSIKNQSYTNWEVIAVDDGSTDNSLQILDSYAKQDPRIKIIRQKKHKGIAHALNLGIQKSKGQFLARMDADDLMHKNRLKLQIAHLLDNKDVIVVGGQCDLIDQQNKSIGEKNFPLTHKEIVKLMFLRAPLQHPAIMINKEKLPANFVWYFTNKIPAEDLDLYFRLLPYGKLANLPQTVIRYRQHSNSLSLKQPKKTFVTAQKIRWHYLLTTSYNPGLFTIALNLAISPIFSLLPSSMVYPLYSLALHPKKLLPSFAKPSLALTA